MTALLQLIYRQPVLWAAVATLALHGLWLSWNPAPSRGPGLPPSAAAPRVIYEAQNAWPDLLRRPAGDARLIRSSALFALPTPSGFSGPELTREVRHAPLLTSTSLVPRSTIDRRLDLAGAAVPPAWSRTATGLPVLAAAPPPPVFTRGPAPAGDTLQVRWSADFPEVPVRTLSARDAPWQDAAPWELAAAVRYDHRGVASEVFLEPPGPRADRNAAAVRLLRTLAPPRSLAGHGGRVVLRYLGPATASSP